jgi:hypothetical protein
MVLVITPKTLDQIREPKTPAETDNVLLEWECALDLFKAGRIKLMVIEHDFPKPLGKAADIFLETIPDLPTQALVEAGVAICPRRTAREIMTELLSAAVPWFDDMNLHRLIPLESTPAAKEVTPKVESGLRKLARLVDQQWSEQFSWRKQGSRALDTSKQLLAMGAKEAKTKAKEAKTKAAGMAGIAATKAKAKTSKLAAKGKARLQRVRGSQSSDEPTAQHSIQFVTGE